MNLRQLLDGLIESEVPEIEINGIDDDTRTLQPGNAFVAVQGAAHDGHKFLAEAQRLGAAVALVERLCEPSEDLPQIVVPELSRQRGVLADRFFRHPGHALRCIGVTGTNGKTSVASHIASLLNMAERRCGYVGTIGWGVPPDLSASALTTGSAIVTHSRLSQLRDEGCEWAALEVSSHSLDQGRVDEVPFEAAVFTNLSRDHLDYHGDMGAYGQAKKRLFEFPSVALAVINTEDDFGRALAADLPSHVNVIRLGRDGDVRWADLRFHAAGVQGRWETPWGSKQFDLPLLGEFSVANAAAALSVLCGVGLDIDTVVELQRRMPPVPGRMEFLSSRDGPTIVVDYAHTPDALATVLPVLRRHCKGELVCLIGCGGDRDAGKRPLMAAVAEQLADVVWLTSDNPRTEDPERILDDMRQGLSGEACVFECVDRAEAIQRALAVAAGNDLVLIAGKGHEDYQELATGRIPFSDARVVRQTLAQGGAR